jgi:transcriptional regulator with PAS, ATPase and Fis domain
MSIQRNGPLRRIDKYRKHWLRRALQQHKWKLKGAAMEMEISLSTARRWVMRYGLMKPGRVMVRRLVKA